MDYITIIQSVIASLTTALVLAVATWIRGRTGTHKAMQDGIRANLRYNIISDYHRYTRLGYVPICSLEALEETYAAYHALGGNGTITRLVEEIRELPTKEGHVR